MVHLRCSTNASSCEDPRYRADAIEFRMEPHECSIPYVGSVMPSVDSCSGRGWRIRRNFCRVVRDVELVWGPDECVTNSLVHGYGFPIKTNYRAKLLELLEEECRLHPEAPPACVYFAWPGCSTDEPTRCSSKTLDRFGYDPDNPYNQRPWVRCSLESGHEGLHEGGCLCWANLEDEKKRMGC